MSRSGFYKLEAFGFRIKHECLNMKGFNFGFSLFGSNLTSFLGVRLYFFFFKIIIIVMIINYSHNNQYFKIFGGCE